MDDVWILRGENPTKMDDDLGVPQISGITAFKKGMFHDMEALVSPRRLLIAPLNGTI